ncbi:MAG: hypothetical protein ACRD3N_05070 [Terracidiphilus sp.]
MLSLVLAFSGIAALATAQDPTQNFNAYGASTGLGVAGAEDVSANSLTFPGFTLSSGDFLQLDAPGYYGAVNYELLANDSPLTITFDADQSNFSIDLRDYQGYSGSDTITVYGANDTTVLDSYMVAFGADGSIYTFGDSGESAPIGAVALSEISGSYWSGILQSVTYTTVPEGGAPLLYLLLAAAVCGGAIFGSSRSRVRASASV